MKISTLAACALVLAACSTAPGPQQLEQATEVALKASFRDQGIAKVERLNQDEAQKVCSEETPPSDAVATRIEAAQLATIQWPADGVYVGDWREGEKLAQNGRGMTWSDAAGAPSGGNCYNCHRISKAEISFGTIGPSLVQYGKMRGVADVADPASSAVIKYTWGKLWNSKATNACSGMPRFGHQGVLSPAQIRDLMALLLDPKSPVNAQ